MERGCVKVARVTGIDELVQFIQNEANRAKERAERQSKEQTKNQIKRLSDKAVADWYGGYGPNSYDRSGALERYSIVQEGDNFFVDFNQNISSHQNNDLVSEIVIALGYHGGSPGDGTSGINWRTGYNFSEWGDPATWDPAIINVINEGIDEINKKNEERSADLFERYFGTSW